MRHLLCAVLFFMCVPAAMAGFASNVVILEKSAIADLSDEKIKDTYVDVLVELEAINAFHQTSGFTPKQYDEYRNLQRFRMQLLMEMHARDIQLPPQMER